jgi:4-amino-4-deoxychorismate lyase
MNNNYYCFNLENDRISFDSSGIDLRSDRGLAYGHGVFETMLYQQSIFPLKDRHFSRLLTDSSALGIPVPEAALEDAANAFTLEAKRTGFEDGIVKIILTAGSGGRGYASPEIVNPKLIFSHHSMDEQWIQRKEDGIKLWRCEHLLSDSRVLAGVKHLNRLDQVLGASEARANGFIDGLMFNSDGYLVESTCANVFLRSKKHGWITPSIETAGIRGVMRSLLIDEIFPSLDLPLKVIPIELGTLRDMTELFICNSVRGIVPVTGLSDDKTDNLMKIGRETRILQSTLANLYQGYK